MRTRIYVSPASSGKTAYVLELARQAAQGLGATPRVVVASYLQARAWRRRLAEAGGAIGVRILTFDRLYAECLAGAAEAYTQLSDPVQFRVVRAIVDELRLVHYGVLSGQPGFIQALGDLISELKVARVLPETFVEAVKGLGDDGSGGEGARLSELALVYQAYQDRMRSKGWTDRAGMGWLAVETVERESDLARDWRLLIVDGFDSFTPVQLELLQALSRRVERVVVTLTGNEDGPDRALAHRRFERTRSQLEAVLGVTAEPFPQPVRARAPVLAHLEMNLFRRGCGRVEPEEALHMVVAPDRAGEVRAALRWLKERIVTQDVEAGDAALLARNITPYREFVLQIADEFGLPVHLVSGLPLGANPAVVAVLNLLRLVLPYGVDDSEPALPWRRVIETWRSPYFDWSALPERGATKSIGINPRDTDALDIIARWGSVVGGLSQWSDVLANLASRPGGDSGEGLEGVRGNNFLSARVPVGAEALEVWGKFQRFLKRLTPPVGEHSYREFVCWLEDLIGPDPALQSELYPALEEPTALQIVACARSAGGLTAERDVAALQALKDVLRGLVWSEEALVTRPVRFPRFFNELEAAVDAASYRLPVTPRSEKVLVADVVQSRGVQFRAVAVLGVAEGEFPAVLSEDAFLRDAHRKRLHKEFGLPLELSTESSEAEFFYEAMTRPREWLLLTRPRLAENGAIWQPSPFWEDVRRLVIIEPEMLTSEDAPAPSQAASWSELMESLAIFPLERQVRAWIEEQDLPRLKALDDGSRILRLREVRMAGSPYNGDLSALSGDLTGRFGARHRWSASRLESYRACPFMFFTGSVLRLQPLGEPTEGLDARQLGNIYHRIFERIYPAVTDPTDLDQLLAALPRVAQEVLDTAPRDEGFRETAWWRQTCDGIVEHVRLSLEELDHIQADFVPCFYEAKFGLDGEPYLTVSDGEDAFRLRGLIDRVDRKPDGRVRVVDYKTAGPGFYKKSDVARGKKLQVPLYALAARDALQLGDPVDGFYWHVQQAKRSGFTLHGFDGGAQAAIALAVTYAWEAVRGCREGRFVPDPPAEGCPLYCPAAGFCWQYRAGYGG